MEHQQSWNMDGLDGRGIDMNGRSARQRRRGGDAAHGRSGPQVAQHRARYHEAVASKDFSRVMVSAWPSKLSSAVAAIRQHYGRQRGGHRGGKGDTASSACRRRKWVGQVERKKQQVADHHTDTTMVGVRVSCMA